MSDRLTDVIADALEDRCLSYGGRILTAEQALEVAGIAADAIRADYLAHNLDALTRVRNLAAEYRADDNEHLNRFGQYHPYAGWAADHLEAALNGKPADD